MNAGGRKAGAWGAWTKFWSTSLAVALALLCSPHSAQAKTKLHHLTNSRHFAERHHHELASHNTHAQHLAARAHHHYASRRGNIRVAHESWHRHHERLASAHYRYSRLECVPYAREVSHIQLSGNAFLWWAEAAGRYARGATPVEGAVLNFRSIRRMPLGHVAVVTAVLDNRTILVTQANWIRGTITNDVTMQDVSPNNDWSQVEVELGDSSRWGAAYPTYGFIYNQPASSTIIANTTQGDEVAEAPRPQPIASDAPDRNLQ